jgi:Ser/Thr protein kinase RdoA (MazF antagonist)
VIETSSPLRQQGSGSLSTHSVAPRRPGGSSTPTSTPGIWCGSAAESGVFDFDGCGAGHYLFALAVALANWSDGGAQTDRYQAILTGYAHVRPLLPRDERLLPTLMQGRACRSIIGWLQRTPSGIAPSAYILGLLAQLRRLAGVNGD